MAASPFIYDLQKKKKNWSSLPIIYSFPLCLNSGTTKRTRNLCWPVLHKNKVLPEVSLHPTPITSSSPQASINHPSPFFSIPQVFEHWANISESDAGSESLLEEKGCISGLIMRFVFALNLLYGPTCPKLTNKGSQTLYVKFYHHLEEPHEEYYSNESYERAYPKLVEMSQLLKNVDSINGKLVNIEDGSTILDERLEEKMHVFKSFTRTFLGSPFVRQGLKKKVLHSSGENGFIPISCFSRPSEREPMVLNTLTKVCDYLNVSAQQRKVVRFNICSQVTEYRIWSGTLEAILKGLKSEMELLNHCSIMKEDKISEQIISSCFKFLGDLKTASNPEAISWMRLKPSKKIDSPNSHEWGDLLDMVNDLTKCLKSEKGLPYHALKIEVMKEGLYQIKDVLVDREIGYKEVRHQENLVQKRLSKYLGHSSSCLFTLLLYYLFGNVRDLEVEVSGGVYGGNGKDRYCLCIGKILTSGEEKTLSRGVKQLDRALGLFKFIWETAGMKGVLDLQGHLWYFGTKDRRLTYRGNEFFLHGIRVTASGNA